MSDTTVAAPPPWEAGRRPRPTWGFAEGDELAPGRTVLRRIVIPHAMPGIVAGCIIVFMLTVGNFATPVLLGGKNGLWFTEQIYAQFITRFNWPQGAAFGMLLLLLSSAIVWLGLRLTGQSLGTTLKQA